MAPRRSHTKSRLGCDQCKKRRVKCDEKSPCANCVSRELKCTFFNVPSNHVASNKEPCTAEFRPASSLASSGNRQKERSTVSAHKSKQTFNVPRIRDLELMHKFSTDTFRSLCTKSSEHHVWQVELPRMAMYHDFLLSGMLALASLHIATTIEPVAAWSYIDTALQYHSRAFAPFREALDHLTPDNCDAVFAHSAIITVFGIALPRLTAEHDEGSNMTENIIVVFELLRGVSKIENISRPWLRTRLFPSRDDFWNAKIANLDNETEAALTRLTALNDSTLGLVDTEQHRINKQAISLLKFCFSRYTAGADVSSVLAWLAAVDKEFVQSLRRRLPIGLLILMHWGVLLGELDGQFWWSRNSGRAMVCELLEAIRPGDAQWEAARMWPRTKLGL